jgi:hypothetical protein
VSFSELWSGAADGTIAEDSMVGLDSIPDQYWPLTSIFSRAIAVAKVFDKADADHSGTLSSKEFITWLRAQSDETIPLELGNELKDFQALDANNDGMLSHVEFLAFILHHMNSKVMSPSVVALCHWIDANLSRKKPDDALTKQASLYVDQSVQLSEVRLVGDETKAAEARAMLKSRLQKRHGSSREST